jgi:hypothetical protein
MRYKTGEQLWVMWADIQDAFMYPFYSKLVKFAEMEPADFPAVQFRLLTVNSEHKVNGEYDSNDAEPTYVWYNQYPYACLGGQLSNGSGHLFKIAEGCDEGVKLLEWMKANEKGERGPAPTPASMALLTNELREIRREIHTMETGQSYFGQTHEIDLERAAKLRAWFEHILGEFGKQTGLSIIEEPFMIDSEKEGRKHLDGWYEFTIVEAPANEA